MRDAQHDDAEHDGGDDHLDQLDEPVAKRLQRLREVRPYGADDDAQYKGHDDLEEKGLVERLAPGGLNRAVMLPFVCLPCFDRATRALRLGWRYDDAITDLVIRHQL